MSGGQQQLLVIARALMTERPECAAASTEEIGSALLGTAA
jgi:ABC-type phosphate transport system ATPase subunit